MEILAKIGSQQVLKYLQGKDLNIYFIPVSSGMFTLDNENWVKIAYLTGYFLV